MTATYQVPTGVTHLVIVKRGDMDGGNVEVIPVRSYQDGLLELRIQAVTEWGLSAGAGARTPLKQLQRNFSRGHEEDFWELAILPFPAAVPVGSTHVLIIKRADELDDGETELIPASSPEQALAKLREIAVAEEWGGSGAATGLAASATLETLQALFYRGHEEDFWEFVILPFSSPRLSVS